MQLFAILTIACALALAAHGREIPDQSLARVSGGTVPGLGDYPFTVSLRVYFEHFCGGSILNNRWVLTAAQCLQGKEAHEISVIAGTLFLSEAGQMYQAVKIFSHPDYNRYQRVNDVALIFVSRDIKFNGKVQPISLPASNAAYDNQAALFTGWGANTVNDDFSPLLQAIQLTVIPQKTCAAKQNKITNNNLCTTAAAGKGACKGDTGGPLVIDGVQVGIFSYNTACGSGNPDVFTRVSSFVEWAKKTMA